MINDHKFINGGIANAKADHVFNQKTVKQSDLVGIASEMGWLTSRKSPDESDPLPAGTLVQFIAPTGIQYQGKVASKAASDYIVEIEPGQSYLVPAGKLQKVDITASAVRDLIGGLVLPKMELAEEYERGQLHCARVIADRRPSDRELQVWSSRHFPDLRLVDAVDLKNRNFELVFEMQAAAPAKPQGGDQQVRGEPLSSEEVEGTGVIAEAPKHTATISMNDVATKQFELCDVVDVKTAQMGQPGDGDAYQDLVRAARWVLARFNDSNPDYYAVPQSTESAGDGDNRVVRLAFALNVKSENQLSDLYVNRQGSLVHDASSDTVPARGFVQVDGQGNLPMVMIQGPTGPESAQEYGFKLSANINKQAVFENLSVRALAAADSNPKLKQIIEGAIAKEAPTNYIGKVDALSRAMIISDEVRNQIEAIIGSAIDLGPIKPSPGTGVKPGTQTNRPIENVPFATTTYAGGWSPAPALTYEQQQNLSQDELAELQRQEKLKEYSRDVGDAVWRIRKEKKDREKRQEALYKGYFPRRAQIEACLATADEVLGVHGSYSAEAQAEFDARLTKLAVDDNAKKYWSGYFKEYGKQWTRDIPRRKHDASMQRVAMHKAAKVDDIAKEYWTSYFDQGAFGARWYGEALTKDIVRHHADGSTDKVASAILPMGWTIEDDGCRRVLRDSSIVAVKIDPITRRVAAYHCNKDGGTAIVTQNGYATEEHFGKALDYTLYQAAEYANNFDGRNALPKVATVKQIGFDHEVLRPEWPNWSGGKFNHSKLAEHRAYLVDKHVHSAKESCADHNVEPTAELLQFMVSASLAVHDGKCTFDKQAWGTSKHRTPAQMSMESDWSSIESIIKYALKIADIDPDMDAALTKLIHDYVARNPKIKNELKNTFGTSTIDDRANGYILFEAMVHSRGTFNKFKKLVYDYHNRGIKEKMKPFDVERSERRKEKGRDVSKSEPAKEITPEESVSEEPEVAPSEEIDEGEGPTFKEMESLDEGPTFGQMEKEFDPSKVELTPKTKKTPELQAPTKLEPKTEPEPEPEPPAPKGKPAPSEVIQQAPPPAPKKTQPIPGDLVPSHALSTSDKPPTMAPQAPKAPVPSKPVEMDKPVSPVKPAVQPVVPKAVTAPTSKPTEKPKKAYPPGTDKPVVEKEKWEPSDEDEKLVDELLNEKIPFDKRIKNLLEWVPFPIRSKEEDAQRVKEVGSDQADRERHRRWMNQPLREIIQEDPGYVYNILLQLYPELSREMMYVLKEFGHTIDKTPKQKRDVEKPEKKKKEPKELLEKKREQERFPVKHFPSREETLEQVGIDPETKELKDFDVGTWKIPPSGVGSSPTFRGLTIKDAIELDKGPALNFLAKEHPEKLLEWAQKVAPQRLKQIQDRIDRYHAKGKTEEQPKSDDPIGWKFSSGSMAGQTVSEAMDQARDPNSKKLVNPELARDILGTLAKESPGVFLNYLGMLSETKLDELQTKLGDWLITAYSEAESKAKESPEGEPKEAAMNKSAAEMQIQQPRNHNHIKVTRMYSSSSTQDSGYVTFELAWDPEQFEGMSEQNVHHQLISFIKGLESDKYFHDFGVMGKPKVMEMDIDAGVARIKVRCSQTRSVPALHYTLDPDDVDIDLEGVR